VTSISLAVVFFNALSGSVAYARMQRIDYKSGLWFALATLPGAILGALSTSYVPRHLFNGVFGALLIAASIFLFFYERKEKAVHEHHNGALLTRQLTDRDGVTYTFSYNLKVGLAISAIVGYVSSFLGIGGGIIHVPALAHVLDFPIHVATATSHFVLAIMALAGTIAHIMTGAFAHGAYRTIALAIGVLIGAQLGAKLSNRVHGKWIIRGLAIALGFVGARILVMAL
jgi:hypothetical protein